jgi:D-lactate dehydrogenase
MLNVYFYEAFKEEQVFLRKYLPADITAGFTHHTIQESGLAELPAPIISIRTQSRIPDDWQMSALLTRSTGFDHVSKYTDKTACGYLPLYCARAVAEQTLMLMLCLLRKLPKQIKHFETFYRDHLTGHEALDKTMVVYGVGNIGYEVYKIASALGMKTYGVDIVERHNDVRYISKEDGLKNADILVCAMNLTADNLHYFNYDCLSKAKKGVLFINVARGELSPSQDLLALINNNRLAGLALDAYNKESILAESLRANKTSDDQEVKATLELRKKDTVILTPHNAFNTHQSVERKAKQSIDQILHFLKKNEFIWKVES